MQFIAYLATEIRMNSPDTSIILSAGPLQAVFFPGELFLRYLEVDGREALRGTYVAMRDQNWKTLAPQVEITRQDLNEETFCIACTAVWESGPVKFVGECKISGNAKGVIRYGFSGECKGAFLTNRLGFVVLHGAQLAGQPVKGVHTDGTEFRGTFPESISPHQPFLDLRTLRHRLEGGREVEVLMEGDIFEMEDQRNWTDASYKTYCTPLSKPFPRQLTPGDRIDQCITISLQGRPSTIPATRTSLPSLRRPENVQSYSFPQVGIAMADGDIGPHTDWEIGLLRELDLDYLRCGTAQLGNEEIRLAQALALPLEIAVTDDGCSPEFFAHIFDQCIQRPRIHRLLLAPGNPGTLAPEKVTAWRSILEKVDPIAELIVGTDGPFTELNRAHPPMEGATGVCYSLNPQVHAFDDASLVETLPMQALTAVNAKAIARDRRVIVSPVTLRPRPKAKWAERCPEEDDLYAQPDPRQSTAFGFAWTCGSLLNLAASPVDAVTYYQTRGKSGLMDTGNDKNPFPLYHAFHCIRHLKTCLVSLMDSSHPCLFQGFSFTNLDRTTYAVVNYCMAPQTVGFEAPLSAPGASVRSIFFEPHKGVPSESKSILEAGEIHLPPLSLTFVEPQGQFA